MIDYNNYSFLNNNINNLLNLSKEDNKQLQYKLFYKGDIDELIYFYKSTLDQQYKSKIYTYTPSFLKLAPTGESINTIYGRKYNNFTIYFDPLAANISRSMSGLLFSKPPVPTLTLNNKNNSEEYQNTLNEILNFNKLGSLLQKAGEYESYSGAVAFKLIIDKDFTEYPIIQIYAKEDFIAHKKYDKLVSIVFKDEYKHSNKIYTLYSEYGKGYINYKLMSNNTTKEVSLDTIPETSGLKNIEYRNSKGKLLDIMYAVYKENKPGARSDYENCIDDFQAAIEIYSNMMNFIRKTGVKRLVSESIFKTSIEGSKILPNSYDEDVIIKWNNTPNQEQETNTVQTVDKVQETINGYIMALNEVRENIARTVKLSIKTIMGKDESGANESEKALMIRENIDFRTRDNKLVSWSESYNELILKLMMLYTGKINNNIIEIDTLDDLNSTVEFYNMSTPTFNENIEEITKLRNENLIDDLGALMRLWFDSGLKSEEEVLEMYELIYGSNEETEEESNEETEESDDMEEETEEESNDEEMDSNEEEQEDE